MRGIITARKPVEPRTTPAAERGTVASRPLEETKGEQVVVASCAPEDVKTKFFSSLLEMTKHEQYGTEASRIERVFFVQPGPRIAHGRNLLVGGFLELTEAEWLVQLDYDVTFPPNALDFWLTAAHPTERPIAQIMYHGIFEDTLTPFAYQHEPGHGEVAFSAFSPEEGTIVPVGAVAAGATIVHRSVFEKMKAEYEDEYAPYTWYGEYGVNGRDTTEDVIFSVRAREMGFPMVVDNRISLGHLKMYNFGERF